VFLSENMATDTIPKPARPGRGVASLCSHGLVVEGDFEAVAEQGEVGRAVFVGAVDGEGVGEQTGFLVWLFYGEGVDAVEGHIRRRFGPAAGQPGDSIEQHVWVG